MKRTSSIIALFIIFLLSCGRDEDRARSTQVQQDEGSVTTGRPEHSLNIARGIWRKSEGGCTQGFGICQLTLMPHDQTNPIMDTLKEGGERSHLAVLTRNTADPSEMTIEFQEKIPQFADQFVVDAAVTIRNLFGHEWVRPVLGTYSTDRSTGQYGSVKIKIEVGPESGVVGGTPPH
ncbi:MAG: hypothetical protein ACK40G_18055 [Cytophagaceae bacterium]